MSGELRRHTVRLRALRRDLRKWSKDFSWEGRYQRVWYEKEMARGESEIARLSGAGSVLSVPSVVNS